MIFNNLRALQSSGSSLAIIDSTLSLNITNIVFRNNTGKENGPVFYI